MTLETSFNSLISRLFSNCIETVANDRFQPIPITTVPIEVLRHIFSFLTPKEQLKASEVCRSWAIAIFDNPINGFVLENAKTLASMRTDGAVPDFFSEARFYHHMNVRMSRLFAQNLQKFDINPSPFPNVLFTELSLPKAIELDEQRTLSQQKKDRALIRFYNLLQTVTNFPEIPFELPEIMAQNIRHILNTTANATVNSITVLDLKPDGTELDFFLPQEICLFTSLKTLKVSGEILGIENQENVEAFIPSATFHFPSNLGMHPSLKHLELAFFKNIGLMPTMPKLTFLYYRACKNLSAIPNELVHQTGLQQIEILGCHGIQTLPESIGKLAELEKIKIALCNSITCLPSSLTQLRKLKKFEIFACPKLYKKRAEPELVELFKKIKDLPLMQEFRTF